MTQNGTVPGKGTATKKVEELKIVIVGDGGCGKTSLLMVYANGDFPEVRRGTYTPCVTELLIIRNYLFLTTLGGKLPPAKCQ